VPSHEGYDIGNWLAACDRCGRVFRFKNEIQKEWTGLYVCKETCWEARNAQDFIRGVKDDTSVPVSRIQQFYYLGQGSGDRNAIAGSALAMNPFSL